MASNTWPYKLIFCPKVEEKKCIPLNFLEKSFWLLESGEKAFFKLDSEKTFSPHSSNQNDFFMKIGWYTFFLLYILAKYESIWSYISAQTVTLDNNLLFMAQTIPQNAHCACFFYQKLLLLKIFKFWIWLRFSRSGIFAILKYVSSTVRL